MGKVGSKEQLVEKKLEAPPVVTILGHVDHGKTTLLDYIRKSHVAEKEFGDITQHIGAYQVDYKGKSITFIDTPGHEAFSQMRSRGARVTDLAILVVAADDGVMPQTKESIAHIKKAAAPLIVAINKMDLPSANVEKVKKQLAEEGVLVEGYGGDVVAVPISAKTGQGISELLEMVQLVAEISGVKKDTQGEFEGVVIESYLDRFRGPVATIIVKKGSLRVGDTVFGDSASGKIKSLIDSNGKGLRQVGVSAPVEILGLEKVPAVGDVLSKKTKERPVLDQKEKKVDWSWSIEPKSIEIRLILKADTYGSLEAITNSIEAAEADSQEVKFIHKETGDVTENDVLLAASTKSIIIGFNVKVAGSVQKVAEEEGVNIRTYKLIYELLDELEEGLTALAAAEKKKEVLGEAKILAVFDSGEGKIAGGKITSGRINKVDNLVVRRGDKVLGETKIKSMKHKLLDINEAKEDEEFGIIFEQDIKFKEGDIIQATEE